MGFQLLEGQELDYFMQNTFVIYLTAALVCVQ